MSWAERKEPKGSQYTRVSSVTASRNQLHNRADTANTNTSRSHSVEGAGGRVLRNIVLSKPNSPTAHNPDLK
jgi:hypothetical protein